MTNQQAPFAFREGAEDAQEAAKGAAFPGVHFFNIDDGDTVIVRFLHDYITHRNPDGTPMFPHLAHPSYPMSTSWIVVDQHNYVPTRNAPAGYTGNWPKSMSATCRREKAFGGMFPDCFICEFVKKDNKPFPRSGRSWSLAVLREEVKENGVVQGYRDAIREVAVTGADGKPTGEVIKEKAFLVVNMGWKNFFSSLEGIGKVKGQTILDKDFVIIRKGGDQNTDYQIVDLPPIPAADGTPFDLRNPQHFERYKNDIDIPGLIAERASDEYYARFFDTRVDQPTSQGQAAQTNGAPAEQQQKPPDVTVDDAKMQAMAARVKGYAAGDGGTEPDPAQPGVGGQPPEQEQPAPQAAPATAATGTRNFD